MDVDTRAQAEQPHPGTASDPVDSIRPSESAPDQPPASQGLWATAVDLFAAPSSAFARIQRHPTILFPLLLVMIPMLAVTLWYFQVVDWAWFVDDTISRFPEMDAEQREAIRAAYASQSPAFTMWSGVLGSVISVMVIYGLHAGYLSLVSLMTGDGYRFRHWFSLLSWTNLPMLLVTLVMAVNIFLSSNGQVSLYDANSLSLASLGMQADSTALRSMFDTFSLPMLWALALLVVAYRQWLNCGWLRAGLVVLAPYLLIIGIVLFFVLG